MSRETPQAAFDHAQAAMLRGDLFEVFACLDVNDLKPSGRPSSSDRLEYHGSGWIPD